MCPSWPPPQPCLGTGPPGSRFGMPSHTRGESVSIKQKKKIPCKVGGALASVGFRGLPVENVAIWRHSPTADFPNAVPPLFIRGRRCRLGRVLYRTVSLCLSRWARPPRLWRRPASSVGFGPHRPGRAASGRVSLRRAGAKAARRNDRDLRVPCQHRHPRGPSAHPRSRLLV